MTLFLVRAPGGGQQPAAEVAAPGSVLVTLVPASRFSTPRTPAALMSAIQPSVVASALPVGGLAEASGPAGRSDQVSFSASSAPSDAIGAREVESQGEKATRGAQTASTTSAAGSDYRARLLAHIQPFRRYPPQAEALDAKGVTQLVFMVDQSGRIMGVWVKSSSGFEALDNEAVATVWRAQPMPHVPPGLPSPLAVQLPVSFNPS